MSPLLVNSSQLFIILPFFLYAFSLGSEGDYYFSQKAGVIGFLGLCFAWHLTKRYGWLFGAFSFYALSSLVYLCFWRQGSFVDLSKPMLFMIQRAAAHGTLSAVLIWAVVSVPMVSHATLIRCFSAFGVYVSIHFWFLSSVFAPEGFLMGFSTSGIFLALLVPFVRGWLKLGFFLTAFFMGGHTAVACLGGLLFGYLYNLNQRLTVALGALAVTGVGIAAYLNPYAVLKDQGHGRFQIWRMTYDWWVKQGQPWMGMGTGTTYSLVPIIQQETKTLGEGFWIYLHSDLFQVGFELGIVGVVLVLALFIQAWRRCGDSQDRAFLCALAPACLTFFPFRHETLLFLVALGVHRIFTTRLKQSERLT